MPTHAWMPVASVQITEKIVVVAVASSITSMIRGEAPSRTAGGVAWWLAWRSGVASGGAVLAWRSVETSPRLTPCMEYICFA